jgi:hypothetical protein
VVASEARIELTLLSVFSYTLALLRHHLRHVLAMFLPGGLALFGQHISFAVIDRETGYTGFQCLQVH